MSTTTDFIAELVFAANTLHLVTPLERQRLIERGLRAVQAQHDLLALHGNVVPLRPAFLTDMETLARLAGVQPDADLMVAAGMLLLAEEIRRLRMLLEADKVR